MSQSQAKTPKDVNGYMVVKKADGSDEQSSKVVCYVFASAETATLASRANQGKSIDSTSLITAPKKTPEPA